MNTVVWNNLHWWTDGRIDHCAAAVACLQFPIQVCFCSHSSVTGFPRFTFIFGQKRTLSSVTLNYDLWPWPTNFTYIGSRWITTPVCKSTVISLESFVRTHSDWNRADFCSSLTQKGRCKRLIKNPAQSLTLSYPLASAVGQSKILLAILCSAWLDIELVS